MLKMKRENGSMEKDKEEWRQIREAPWCYVSNLGRVKVEDRTTLTAGGYYRTSKGHLLAPNKKKTGYLEVTLPVTTNKRIYRSVHRLVLETFNPVENMENLEVNHKDEDKTNNNLSNLEWMTSKENCNYGTRNERTGEKRRLAVKCIETGEIYPSGRAAAKAVNCPPSSICNCCKGIRKRAGGYHWEYYNEK